MNKVLLKKSFKFFSFTLILLFLSPIVIYQAFRNEEHPFYLPVLIIGLILSFAAIGLGFYSIKTILNALYDREKKNATH